MTLLTDFVEWLAIKTGVPNGGVWLLILTGGGGFWLVWEYPFFNKSDLIIGFVMWAIAYVAMWIYYRDEFWMSPKLLSILRKGARGEFDDDERL